MALLLQQTSIFESEFFDVERVEVLRGPQGTLYGRGAIGGVVNTITVRPTDEFETRAAVEAEQRDSRESAQRAQEDSSGAEDDFDRGLNDRGRRGARSRGRRS